MDKYENMTLNQFLNSAGVGNTQQILTNLAYGINHSRVSLDAPRNKSTYGWVFFTRPQLNLRTDNIRNVREFYNLLSKNPLSVSRYIRVTLDPRLPYKLLVNGKPDDFYSTEIIDTPLVDKYNPFIPLLTNSIKSISGWPDEVLPTYNSTQGIRKEQFSMVDGTYETNEVFDLSATFKTYESDPLLLLFQTWTRYASLVFEGLLNPYWDFVLENEIDYNTRIWRITTDSKWEYVNYIACTGASYPVVNPVGKYFDFNKEKPYSDQVSEFTMRFKCIGAMYNDPILVKEFNMVHAIFNPAYKEYLKGNTDFMVEIPKELREFLNFRGYPYIDPNTYKLKWLINKDNPSYKKLIDSTDKDLYKLEEDMNTDNQPVTSFDSADDFYYA